MYVQFHNLNFMSYFTNISKRKCSRKIDVEERKILKKECLFKFSETHIKYIRCSILQFINLHSWNLLYLFCTIKAFTYINYEYT